MQDEIFFEQDNIAIEVIDNILSLAIEKNASDIHFEAQENNYRIRLRIDGILENLANQKLNLAARLTTRLKIMANLDIAEKRLPQDGRFKISNMDFRISSCPTIYGEKIVVRILNSNSQALEITQLGLTEKQQKTFISTIKRSQGLILVTGPTGSGKTSTLYSALNFINSPEKNIVTVEDPVEILLPGINQVNIKPIIGLDFARILRAFLRQDPDIIMIGEIRDSETANIAVKAAQTGHLVLATLHANHAAAAITRMLNMGIKNYNLSSALTLIVGQRLLRKKSGTGYQGRTGIFELLQITPKITEMIINHKSSQEIRNYAVENGMQELNSIANELVKKNVTDNTELERVL